MSLLGLFDTIEWQYMERVENALGFLEHLEIYRSRIKQSLSDGDAYGPLWKRFKSKSVRTLSRFFRRPDRPAPQSAWTIEDVNVYAASNYRPKVYPARLTLFRSTNRGPLDGDDAYLGWRDLVGGGIEVHHIPSSHLSILQEPGVRILSEKLRECLDRDITVAATELEIAAR